MLIIVISQSAQCDSKNLVDLLVCLLICLQSTQREEDASLSDLCVTYRHVTFADSSSGPESWRASMQMKTF